MTSNTDFNLKHIDVLLERPAMLNLLEASIKGSFQGVDVDTAFEGLKETQKVYFSKLLTKIFTKGLKKKAKERARLAKVMVDAEMEAETKALPVWAILPKKEATKEVSN